MTDRFCRGYAPLKFLRARASAGCWRMQGNELLELDGNLQRKELRMSLRVIIIGMLVLICH
jgi:hypothetical protein